MTNDERAAKLERAKELILEVRNSFSNERVVCDHCGFERFQDFNQRQLREQLNGAVTRLTRVVERMLRTEGAEDWVGQKKEVDEPEA